MVLQLLGQYQKDEEFYPLNLGADGQVESTLSNDESHIIMNGREVFKFAVRQMGESAVNVIEKAGLTKEDVDYLNSTSGEYSYYGSCTRAIRFTRRENVKNNSKIWQYISSIDSNCNSRRIEAGKIKDDDLIVLVGFGGGLTWGASCNYDGENNARL